MNSIEKVYLLVTLIFTGIISYAIWSWKEYLKEVFLIGIASVSILVYALGIHLFFEGYAIMESIIIAETIFALILCIFMKYPTFKKTSYLLNTILVSVALLCYEFYAAATKYSLYSLSMTTLILIATIIFAGLLFMVYITKQSKKMIPLIGLILFANAILYVSNTHELVIIAIALKACFYFYFTDFLHSSIRKEMKAPVEKYKEINKEFDDAVKKEVNKHMFYLELSKDKIKEKSKIDDLTRALNKKAILDLIDKMIEDEEYFSIMMFDIDKFKTINDTHGHVFGDKILKILANITRQSLREKKDIFGRYGGDEFIVVVPKASIKETMDVAERLRSNVEKTKNINYTLTISIGLANYPEDATNTKELIEHADTGLYLSKERGRNKVSHKDNSETTYFKGKL